ncbi:MAG: 2',3'-cyclic-nucleotide 2'-phosphodiesterase, partial [Alphaproteobacteria bacterium]
MALVADEGSGAGGLVRLADLIAEARGEAASSLLLDNGDLLQGGALGDHLAATGGFGPDNPHPMIAAMNALGYDAAALGNHDLDYGVAFLQKALSAAAFPVLCANLFRGEGGTLLPGHRVLEREFTDDAGRAQPLRIGLVGVLPPQVTGWNHRHLAGRFTAGDCVAAVREAVPRLRRDGADLIVTLVHGGISARSASRQENAAAEIARLDGVDAVIAGHQHRLFPGPDFAGPD